MKTNNPLNIIVLKIICSTFKSKMNSNKWCLKYKAIQYIFNIFFIEKKCSNFKINRLQKLNFLELSRKFLMAATIVQDVPFGQRHLQLSNSKIVEAPNVVREMVKSTLSSNITDGAKKIT